MSPRDDRELQRYHDGELSPRRARKVHARLQSSQEDRDRLSSLRNMRSMLHEAHQEMVQEPDFDQLWGRVEAGIEEQRPLPWQERLLGWLRRNGLVLASATAVALAALLLVLLVIAPPASNDCQIESLEVGPGAVSTIFTIDDPEETGETTVIWLSSNEDFSEGGTR